MSALNPRERAVGVIEARISTRVLVGRDSNDSIAYIAIGYATNVEARGLFSLLFDSNNEPGTFELVF